MKRLRSDDVLQVVADLFVRHGPLDHIGSDDGSGSTVEVVRGLLQRIGVKTLTIEPGSPWEYDLNDSVNGKLGDELLNGEIRHTLKEAKELIEQWRRHDDTIGPHSALGYRPPPPQSIQPYRGDSPSALKGLLADRRISESDTGLD